MYGAYLALRLYFLPSLPHPSVLLGACLTGSLEFLTLLSFVLLSLLPPLYLTREDNYKSLEFYLDPPVVRGVPVSGLLTGIGSVAYAQVRCACPCQEGSMRGDAGFKGGLLSTTSDIASIADAKAL